MAVLQATEYQDFDGDIHIHFEELVGTGKNWLLPARIMDMNIFDFVVMLRKEYAAELTIYKNKDGSVRWIGYCWKDLGEARRFKNKLNRIAREKKVTKEWIANG